MIGGENVERIDEFYTQRLCNNVAVPRKGIEQVAWYDLSLLEDVTILARW